MRPVLFVWLTITSFGLMAQPLSELDTAQYFDFWVGNWDAAWDEGDGIVKLGTNAIVKDLDNTVLVENFSIHSGKNAGFKGTSISVYQTRQDRWKQAWADNNGGYFDFTGAFEGDKRMFLTAITQRGDQMVQQRMVFYNITDQSMTWDWESSQDGGKSWNLRWRIFYTRQVSQME